jgi:hypothetical protein
MNVCDRFQPYYEVCDWSDNVILQTNSRDVAFAVLCRNTGNTIWGPFQMRLDSPPGSM